MLILICQVCYAQPGYLVGAVVDSALNKPIPDVTVTYGKQRQKTNSLGQFKLYWESPDVPIAFEHINYQRTTKSGIADSSIIYLVSVAHNIENVVTTGYQSFNKNSSTGSFVQISADQLSALPQEDFISRLDGLADGVLLNRPADGNGQNTAFTVRGLSTLGSVSMSRPLIVLDGFPYEGDPNAINPNDIASITILKDASASAIWGVRAGNGVVVITSKSAEQGRGVKVEINNLTTITESPLLRFTPRIKTSDYIDIERFLFDQGKYTSVLNNRTTRPAITPVVELLNQNELGIIDDETLEKELGYLSDIDIYDQMSKYLYRNMVKHQVAGNLSWGNDIASNYLSLGYDRNSTVLRENSTERISLRNQFEIRPLPRLKLAAAIQFAHLGSSNNNRGENMLSSTISMYPYMQLVGDHGMHLSIPYQYRKSFVDTLHRGILHDWSYTPLDEILYADNTLRNLEWAGTGDISYSIFNGVDLSAKYQYARYKSRGNNIYDTNTYYARNLINRFSKVENGEVEYVVPNGGILEEDRSLTETHSLRFQMNLDRKIGAFGRLRMIIGNETRSSNMDGSTSTIYDYERNFNSIATLDYVNTYPVISNLAGDSRIPHGGRLYGTRARFVSFYMNADLTFAERYSLSLSGRRDASNMFGVKTSQKWNPLWSAGAAWLVTGEDWPFLDPFRQLRLRLTYGKSGNINPNLSGRTIITYNAFRSQLNRLPYATIGNPPDENLRWETVSTWNAGIDLGLKNFPLSASIEGYIKKSTDLFALVTTDPTIGFSSVTKNSAAMVNSGLELNITVDYRLSGWMMRSSLNNTLNNSKITGYYYERRLDTDVLVGSSTLMPVENYPAYSVFAYKWGGLNPEDGSPQGIMENQATTDYNALRQNSRLEDLVHMGTSVPRVFGGFTQTVTYGSIDFSMLFTWRLGHVFRTPSVNYTSMINSGTILHEDYYDRWTKPGDETRTNVPALIYPANSARDLFYSYAEINVEKGDVLRLQNIRIGYRPFTTKSLSGLRFSATFNNLGILWKASKRVADPDYTLMPPSRSLSLGLNWNL